MAIDQPGQYSHAAEVHNFRPGWDGEAFSHSFDLAVTNKNVLIALYGAPLCLPVACLHKYNPGRGARQAETHNQ